MPSRYICARCGVSLQAKSSGGWLHRPFNPLCTEAVHQPRPLGFESPAVPAQPNRLDKTR